MTQCTRCSGSLSSLIVFCPHCGQPNEPDFDSLYGLLPGGRYRIDERLGEGGLSTVFAATDLHTEQQVVVKISDPLQIVRNTPAESLSGAGASEKIRRIPNADLLQRYWNEMLVRMRREVVALAGLQHPHIVRFLDTDLLSDEMRYIVMERLYGRTLRDELARQGRLPLHEALRLFGAVASGLEAVHQRGIIHRDLNPRNLFLLTEETNEQGFECAPLIKIIDFGIARIPQPPGAPPFTQYALLGGTVSYAAPEQCQNQPLDHRSDIYSIGVVLYEMLTGQRPFTGMSVTEIALRQAQSLPVSPRTLVPDLPRGVEQAVMRALAKDPESRPQSISELAAELRPWCQGATMRVIVPLDNFSAEASEEAAGSILMFSANARAAFEPDAERAAPDAEAGLLPELFSEGISETATETRISDETESQKQRTALIEKPDLSLLPRGALRRSYRAPAIATLIAILFLAGFLYGNRLADEADQVISRLAAQFVTPRRIVSDNPGKAPEPLTAEPAISDEPTNSTDARGSAQTARNLTPAAVATRSWLATAREWFAGSASAKPENIGKADSASASLRRVNNPSIQPQLAPVPVPEIASARDYTPAANPAVDQGPSKNKGAEARSTADVSRGLPTTSPPPAEPPLAQKNNEDRIEKEEPLHRQQPDDQRQTENREPGRDQAVIMQKPAEPRVIRWSGDVNREREIRLELPGVPGAINIPQAYRRSVGMIEPPGPHNKWRCVILRVFGRGHTSVVIQWWPKPQSMIGAAGDFADEQIIGRASKLSRAMADRVRP